MPTTLDYERDDVLRDNDGQELGRIRYGLTDAYMTVEAGELAYDVVRHGRHGWHFTLMQASGAGPLCELHRYRLREGGGLVGPAIAVRLTHKLWSGDWKIAGLGAVPVVATHARRRGLRRRLQRQGPLQGTMEVTDLIPKLELVSESPLPQTRETIPILVFAGWLIVQWEAVPVAAIAPSGP